MADSTPAPTPEDGWKTTGVRVIPGDQLDTNTAQTPGTILPFPFPLFFLPHLTILPPTTNIHSHKA
jgi:hypothetical protein